MQYIPQKNDSLNYKTKDIVFALCQVLSITIIIKIVQLYSGFRWVCYYNQKNSKLYQIIIKLFANQFSIAFQIDALGIRVGKNRRICRVWHWL